MSRVLTVADVDSCRVAFVGLGTMGRPMAASLLRAGHQVTVVPHRSPAAAAELERHGAVVASSPAEAAAAAEYLITMLPTEREVAAVLFGDQGATSTMPEGGLVLDMSTIGPATARSFRERLAPHSLAFLDAPVSGGPAAAEAGTLTVIVGGDDSALKRAEPVLTAMAGTVFHAGPTGAGQTAKACNNLLVAACMLANVEALTLGAAGGIEPQRLREIVLACSGSNWQLENIVPRTILTGDFTPLFALPLLRKDLGIAATMAADSEAPFLVGGLASELYRLAGVGAERKQDFSSVLKVYEALAGATLDGLTARAAAIGHEPAEEEE